MEPIEPKGTVQITRVPGDVIVVRAEGVAGKIVLVLTYDQANELWGELGNQLQGHETE